MRYLLTAVLALALSACDCTQTCERRGDGFSYSAVGLCDNNLYLQLECLKGRGPESAAAAAETPTNTLAVSTTTLKGR